MNDLKDIKKSINDSIDKVINIPKIEVDNFSTQQLKDEVIPLLKDAEKRIYDIEAITDNINGIKNEIINPVNATIKDNAKQSNWLAWIGIISGLTGVFLTLFSFFHQGTILSSETLSEIEKINSSIVKEQIVVKARELIRYNENIKYEQNILLTYKTSVGKERIDEYYDYLNGIGYKNINKISPDSIRYYHNYESNTIPYVYYRIHDVNDDILHGLEQYSQYYSSSRYGNIIALMYYELSTEKYVKWVFEKKPDTELLIVL